MTHQAQTQASYSEIVRILNTLGIIEDDHPSERSVRVCCPIHCGSDPNCVIDLETGRWKCWSHGCDEKYGNDIVGLVSGTKAISYREAYHQYENLSNSIAEVRESKPRQKRINKILSADFSRVRWGSDYFTGRGFSSRVLQKFQVFECNDKTKAMSNRAVVPIRNEDHRLVGFTGRDKTGFSQSKWLHMPKSFSKSAVLYNLNNAKHYITQHKTVILVEGPIDVWRLDECHLFNAVAMLGTDISSEQIDLLKKYGAKKIILLLDPDSAGLKKTMSGKLFNKLTKDFEIFSLRHLLKDDVGDTPIHEIRSKIYPEVIKIVDEKPYE